jgi:hypothetical protein
MSQNKYLYEWLATEHYRELEREREQIHVLANLPRQHYNVGRHLMSKFGTVLVSLGTRLEQLESTSEQVIRPAKFRA